MLETSRVGSINSKPIISPLDEASATLPDLAAIWLFYTFFTILIFSLSLKCFLKFDSHSHLSPISFKVYQASARSLSQSFMILAPNWSKFQVDLKQTRIWHALEALFWKNLVVVWKISRSVLLCSLLLECVNWYLSSRNIINSWLIETFISLHESCSQKVLNFYQS